MLAMMMLYDCVAQPAGQPVERRPALVGRAHFCLSSFPHAIGVPGVIWKSIRTSGGLVEYGRGIWSHWQADTPPLVKRTVLPVAVRSTTHSRGLPYHALLASAYAPMASQRSRVRFDISTTFLRGTWTLRMHP
jgi:hypothetical protein